VEGKQQSFAGLIGAGGADVGGQCIQIAGIVVVLGDEAQRMSKVPSAPVSIPSTVKVMVSSSLTT